MSDLKQVGILKGQNKNLNILFSGVGDPKGIFLDQMMAHGTYRYFDIMNLHIYPDTESQLINYLQVVCGNMHKYHWSKPVWITEIGMHTSQTGTDNTNMDFFIKVVPAALKKVGLIMRGLRYGILHDPETGYSTLNDDEVDTYINQLGAKPIYVSFDQLRNIDSKSIPVLVATCGESFPNEYFQSVLNYVKRGGTIILPYGAPFYYNRTLAGWNGAGSVLADKLHIGQLYWWTNEDKQLFAPEVPSVSESNEYFGVKYTFDFDKKSGRTAIYLTDKMLKGKDKMVPITFSGNERYKGVVAALYQLDSDLNGNIIIQTRENTQRLINRESEQARRVARFYLIAFAYGIDKVFWYNFRSNELNSGYSEDNFGVVHKDLSPKLAYYAYKTLTVFCPSGSTRPTLELYGDIYISKWTKPDDKKVWVIWDANGTCYKKITITGNPKYYDFLGNELNKVNSNNFKIASGVTYIIGADNVNLI